MNVLVRKFAQRNRQAHPQEAGRGVLTAPRRAGDSPPHRATGEDGLGPWPSEYCANEPSPLHCFGEQRARWALGAKSLLLVLWLASSFSTSAAVREIGVIGLTVGNLDRQLMFYTNVLPFELTARAVSPQVGRAVLSAPLEPTATADLKLGDERITLTEHLANKGRPIPPDSRSFDHWFQHIAIVVRDIDEAYAHLRRHKVKHVSTAPQTLPAWNKDAGGIKAFYFRDPEDHVLEIIWFPPGKGDPKWQRSTTNLFLGIDHTAIVVSDTDKSLAFYRDTLGLRVAGTAENYGTEQEHLNQVFGARLRITALRAHKGPGIEFLEYIAPPGGRPLPAGAASNDLIFWTTTLVMADANALVRDLRNSETVFLSDFLVRDPDGHALRIDGRRPEDQPRTFQR